MLKKIPWNKKTILIIAGIVLGVLAAIYIGFSVFFMSHFYFGTTINGMSVSGNTIAGVKAKTGKTIEDYVLTVKTREDNKEELKGTDMALVQEWDGSIEDLMKKQNGFGWIASLFHKNELTNETLVSFDEKKLEDCVKAMDCMKASNQEAPEDATISEYDEKEGYTVVPSKEGTTLEEKLVVDAVKEAVSGLANEVNLDEKECYQEPKIKDDDEELLASVESLNSYAKSCINYKIGDKTQTLDASTFHEWLSLDENAKPVIDENAVAEYVDTLASTYNTCYQNKTLATSYGTTVSIGNVHYGWKVDNEAEAAAIIDNIKSGETVERDLNYSMTAASHGDQDYGNSYVEINLTSQHLFLYENGSLILESDVITGKPDGSHDTPPGVFGITYCQKDAILRGPGYATHVSYWMPFNGDIGLHDAIWQSAFGAAYYLTKGSHGCVNLPLGVAKTIYEHVQAGFPVLVYDLPGTETEKAKGQIAAKPVVKAISELGDITLDSEAAVAQVRAQYDALSEAGKGFVTNYDVLEAAEATIAQLKADKAAADKAAADKAAADKAAADKAAADKAAADPVIAAIDKIATASDQKAATQDARNKYNALSEDAKKLVTNYDKLTSAEASLQ